MSQSSSTNSNGIGRRGVGNNASGSTSNNNNNNMSSGNGNSNGGDVGGASSNVSGSNPGRASGSGARLNANSADYVISSMAANRNMYPYSNDGYGSEYSPNSADPIDYTSHHPHSHIPNHLHHGHAHGHHHGPIHLSPQQAPQGQASYGQRLAALGAGGGAGGAGVMSSEYYDIRSHDAYATGHATYGSNSTSMGAYYDPMGRSGNLGGASGGLRTSGGLGGAGMQGSGAGAGGSASGGAMDLSSPSSERRKQPVYDSEPPAQPSAMTLAGGSGAFTSNPAQTGGRFNTTLPPTARTVLRAGSRFGSTVFSSTDVGISTPQIVASLISAGSASTPSSASTSSINATSSASSVSNKNKGRGNDKSAASSTSIPGSLSLPILALSPSAVEGVFANASAGSSGAQNNNHSGPHPEQIAIEHFSIPLDQPVEECSITPYISLMYGNSLMLAKPPSNPKLTPEAKETTKDVKDKEAKEPLRADKLLDIVWSRGRKRVCAVAECGKNATMQCLTSAKAGIALESTMFCSAQCLETNWKNRRQALTTAVLERQVPCGVSPTGNTDSEHVPFKCLEDNAGEASLIPRSASNPEVTAHQQQPQRGGGKQSQQVSASVAQQKRRGAAPLRSSAATTTPTSALVPYSGEWFADEDLHPQMQEELVQRLSVSGSVSSANNPAVLALSMKRYEGLACRYPAPLPDIFTPVHAGWTYTPSSQDVGCAIRIDVSPVVVLPKGFSDQDALTAWSNPHLKRWTRLEMTPTLPLPTPRPPRPLIQAPVPSQGPPPLAGLPFKVFNYNILSPQYTTSQMYPYCPPYALAWPYRYHLIMREIITSNPDIICLQEVLQSCYSDLMEAALVARGYQSIFRSKQRDTDDIDGCAILFRKSKFTLVESRLIDFNQLAQHKSLSIVAQRRIARGNIGLAVVLEVNPQGFPNSGSVTTATVSGTGVSTSTSSSKVQQASRSGTPRRFCVANTHIYWDPEYADVKLWQTWQLCRELDDIVKSGRQDEIPLILCGDFNSLPSSSVYKLLTTQHVPRAHPIFKNDRNGVLPPPHNLNHKLILSSAYATAMNDEPPYTNYAGDFQGVLEYIMYTHKSLMCSAVLGMEPESVHKEYTALPSPHFPSDHISLLANFDFVDR